MRIRNLALSIWREWIIEYYYHKTIDLNDNKINNLTSEIQKREKKKGKKTLSILHTRELNN